MIEEGIQSIAKMTVLNLGDKNDYDYSVSNSSFAIFLYTIPNVMSSGVPF